MARGFKNSPSGLIILLVVIATIVLAFAQLFEHFDSLEKLFSTRHEAEEKVRTKRIREVASEAAGSDRASIAPIETYDLEELEDIEIPVFRECDEIIRHSAYALCYSERHEQARWVAYRLTKDHLKGRARRRDNFRKDPKVRTGSANDDDYTHSGYDRGHLAPAGDMKGSRKIMSESFYMSNISPQNREFNGGVWRMLEERVREWVKQDEAYYIVTGPVLRKGLPVIGESRVAVPEYFFKIILDVQEPEFKAIAFLLKNQPTDRPPSDFAVPIDSLEQLTGIDFFPVLPDPLEDTLEKDIDLSLWQF